MTIIIWYGLRRSGNHGLIQLIINSLQCTYFFHNNITLSYENYLKNINKNELSIYKNVEILILSVENKRIDFDEIIKFEKNENVIKVLIIRNPYNMCSSNYEMFGKDVEYLKK